MEAPPVARASHRSLHPAVAVQLCGILQRCHREPILDVLGMCVRGYLASMLEKLNFMKPLVVGGAVAAAIAVMPVAAANAYAGGPASATASTHVVYKQDPGGGGCDPSGNCGSGGQNGGPGGGPGGQGCIPGAGCGSGGVFAGPGGVPGGTGCLPGVGCGSGHG
jgi:hypothetical protein